MTDLGWRDATDLHELVRAREVSPRELAEAALSRIDEIDPPINAVVTRFDDRALTTASSIEDRGQPFYGVPFRAERKD